MFFDQEPSTTGLRSVAPNLDPDTIRIFITSDLHGRRFDPRTLPDADMMVFGGDFSIQPSWMFNSMSPDEVEERVKAQIADGEYIKSLPYAVKLVIPGNHDHLVEEAFDFSHPAPPAGDHAVGSARGRLSGEQKERLRAVYQTDEGMGSIFQQHGLVETTVKGHPFSAFLTGMSLTRRTDGYVFDESSAQDTGLWAGIRPGLDLVLSHGPLRDLMSKCKPGQQLFDRDWIDAGLSGSQSLSEAVEAAAPGLFVIAHIHNGYGDREVEWPNGGSGLIVNAASVITGFTASYNDPDGQNSEYLTPRDGYLVDYNVRTKKSTVVSKWDGTIRGDKVELPSHAGPIIRVESTEQDPDTQDKRETESWEEADTRLVAAAKRVQYSLTQEGMDAWRAKVAEDHAAYKSWLTQFDKYSEAHTLQGTALSGL